MELVLNATFDEIRVARVLSEDSEFMTFEVCKDNARKLNLEDGDRFFTLVFVKPNPDGPPGALVVWKPWET